MSTAQEAVDPGTVGDSQIAESDKREVSGGAHFAALDGGPVTLALATAIDHPIHGQVVVGVKTTDVDAAATQVRRAEMRKERLARALPTREWMKEERERIINKHASVQVQHMFATSFGLSEKFTREFKDFWSLPADWELLEEELGVPTYGSKHRMDLSLMPDVTTVVQVEE